MSDDEFNAAMDRLLEGAHCDTYAELARFLGIGAASISQTMHYKKSIPSNWLITALSKCMVNPMWVLNGYPNAKYLQEKKVSSEELAEDLTVLTAAYMAIA